MTTSGSGGTSGGARRPGRCPVQPDVLRSAFRRILRGYGIIAVPDLVDELVSVADHHAAEESAAASAEARGG